MDLARSVTMKHRLDSRVPTHLGMRYTLRDYANRTYATLRDYATTGPPIRTHRALFAGTDCTYPPRCHPTHQAWHSWASPLRFSMYCLIPLNFHCQFSVCRGHATALR